MQAIICTYKGPTNTKGSRIIAKTASGQSLTLDYHSIDANTDADRYGFAARALCDKLNWKGKLIAGGTADGYVFVFMPEMVGALVQLKIEDLEARTERDENAQDILNLLKTSFY